MSDRGYINLLSHLNRSSTNLPLTTIQASIAHYLANVQPSPTPLAATVISSPLFRVFSHPKLEVLSTAFRHAVHVKLKLLKKEPTSLLSRSLKARLGEWVQGVMKGLQGGQELLRLACYTGLLLGLGDWEDDLTAKESRMRRRVEEELVVSLAEVMELYPHKTALGWEREFKSGTDGQDAGNALSSAFLLASRSLPLVASPRLKALPLRGLISSLLSTIDNVFHSGAFLSTLGSSVTSASEGKLSIGTASSFAVELHQITASPILSSMAPLSRMCGRSLSALADSRPQQGWLAMSETMQRLDALTRTIETDWLRSPLASVHDESDIAPETRKLLTEMWNVLKTVLFAVIMIVQSVLSNLVYVSQPESISASRESESSPFAFSLSVLHLFSNLAFILPQFGGVTSTAEGGLPELKKVFYTALDILSADPIESRRFVRELFGANAEEKSQHLPVHFFHAKKSYALACVEQLIPVLDDENIRKNVYPMCTPHLFDSAHRETYESSHSVMLAIFASHAQKASEGHKDSESGSQPFAEQIVPFYARCLIDNSSDNGLNVVQLRLAYAALVRSAGAFGRNAALSSSSDDGTAGDAFAWFCVEALLQAIRAPQPSSLLSSSSSTTSSSSEASGSTTGPLQSVGLGHLHRLHSTLIATVPSVSLRLLPKLLDEILGIIKQSGARSYRDELVQALFKEISENVGDQEKEFAMRWWYGHRDQMGGADQVEARGKGKGKEKEIVSRL